MTSASRTADTRQRLIDAAIETIRTHGIAHVSARTIAATGDVNQALIFYHFGSVSGLLGEACLATTASRVEEFRARLDDVHDFAGLIVVAQQIHAEEKLRGNVQVLAQVLAGAQADVELAAIVGQSLKLWTDHVEEVLGRLLASSPFGDVVDAHALAQLVSATFVGLELMEPTRTTVEGESLAGLEKLERVAAVVDGLGPLARRAIRATLKP
ncbi:TetR family transcriptional regulator [soil metagenome]